MRRVLAVVLFIVLAMAGLGACAAATADSESDGTSFIATAATCATNPTLEGCPCQAGLTTSCGRVERREGDYVACSIGAQTCGANRKWSACIGDRVATMSVYIGSDSLRAQSLAAAPSTCASNPCDPYCSNYVDTPQGTDAGPAFQIIEAGLGLTPADAGAEASTCTGLAPMSDINMVVTSVSPVVTAPTTAAFSTSLTPASCWTGAFAAIWGTSRYDLGVINSSGTYTHVVPVPATVQVSAYAGAFSATGRVLITVNAIDVSAAPTGYTDAKFTGVTPTSTQALPQVLYPYTNTIFPLGLSAPLLMWKNNFTTIGKAAEVTLRYPANATTPTYLWSAIIAEGSYRFQIPQSAWTAFEQTAKGSPGSLEFQRIDSTGLLQTKVVTNIVFGTGNLRGRIYYTEYASTGAPKVVLPYGSSAPTLAYNNPTLASNCGVCHSMSSTGNKFISSTWGSSNNNNYNTYGISNVDLTTGTLTPLTYGPISGGDSRGLTFGAITSTGTYALLANNWWGNPNNSGTTTAPNATLGPVVKVYKLPTAAGTLATDVSTTGVGTNWGLGNTGKIIQMYTPQFSPDNTRLLFINGDTAVDGTGVAATASYSRQGISYLQFDENAKSFTNRKLVTNMISGGNPASKYTRWPTWENDSRTIMFQTADVSEDDGYNWYGGMEPSGTSTRLKVHGKMYSVDSGPIGGTPNAPVELVQMNAGLGNPSPLGSDDTSRNYQPTMLGVAAGGFRWTVFTSIRAYGNYVNTSAVASLNALKNKLWVAAIDDQVSGTTDRSHPAFYLPNQDTTASTLNERGYWNIDQCKAADQSTSVCASNEECCGYSSTSTSTAECRVDSPLTSPPTSHCLSTTTSTCKTLGNTCGSGSNCCGYPNTQCVSGTCQNPPPIAKYVGATYTRDFSATCGAGQQLQWRFFDWITSFPANPGASVAFSAQTAKTQAGLSAATGVLLGTQTTTNATWTGSNVSDKLTAASPNQASLAWLRVTFTIAPSTDNKGTPFVSNWRQAYDCIDSE